MQEKIDQFFLKYNGVALDYDGVNGAQCVDVAEAFNVEVMAGSKTSGNAIDYATNYPKDLYDFVANALYNFPQKGDIVIWGTSLGVFGHIAVCLSADTNHFISFDQNFPLGSSCHFQDHHYGGVLGWLHPKVNVVVPTTETVTNGQTEYDFGGETGLAQLQTVTSMLIAKDAKIEELLKQVGDNATEIASLQSQSPVITTVTKIEYQSETFPSFLKRVLRL